MHFSLPFLPSTTLSANNCLQIKVWCCVVASKCVLLQIKLCSWVTKPRSCVKNGRSVGALFKYENKLGDKMIRQLLNSVIAKFRDFVSVSRIGVSAQAND